MSDHGHTVSHLLDWYSAASTDHRAAGLDWYPEAEALAVKLERATRGRVSADTACGVIAALSPRCAWPDNKRAALIVIDQWARGASWQSLHLSGVYPENIRKAFALLAAGHVDHCAGCLAGGRHRKTCTAILRGPKVCAFYLAIAGRAEDGAIDVWATRAADVAPAELLGLGPDDPRREGIPGTRYGSLVGAYRAAAAAVGITPRQFQAVVWLAIRDAWIRSDGRVNGRRLDVTPDLPF